MICTIRTAFSPEAFEEQLQKQIAAAVAAVQAAEKKKERKVTQRGQGHSLPPPHPSVEGRCIFSSEASENQPHQEK